MSLELEKSVDESFLFDLIKFDTGKQKPKFDSKDPNEKLKASIVQKLCLKFQIDSATVNFDKTFDSIKSKLKHLHRRFQQSKVTGNSKRQFLDSIKISEPVKFLFIFKEFSHLQSYYEAQIFSLNAHNIELKKKVSELKQFELENMQLRGENASLKAAKKNSEGRGPSKSRLLRYVPYSRSQIFRKKKSLCQQFNEIVKSSGLPRSEQLRSVTFCSNGNMLQDFSTDSRQTSCRYMQDSGFNHHLIDILLFWKDRNLISNASFHELSIYLKENAIPIPSFYAIQQRITEIDSAILLSRTPGASVGIQQSFFQSISNHLRNLLSKGKLSETDALKIKLSSDGTKIGKRLHLITFGYHIASTDLLSRSVKLLCVVKCQEKYNELELSFSDLISEIKALSSVVVDDRVFMIEWCFGADLKMINLSYGLDGCNCKYFCIYCYCKSEDRADFSKFWSMVDPAGQPRSVAKCIEHANIKLLTSRKREQNFNCSHVPLFPFVPITNVIPDTLHLFLRISDVLFMKFLGSLKRLDNIDESLSTYDPSVMTNISRFEQFARKLNIEFDFFIDSQSKKLCFTQLPAQQRMKIFEAINLSHFLPNEKNIDLLKFLWSELLQLYHLMNCELNDDEILQFSQRARNWALIFSQKVYLAADVTPYIHILLYHVTEAMKIHGNLGLYTQQPFEFLNHQITQQYFRASNHAHVRAFEQIFRKQARLSFLQTTCIRIKRKYFKHS